MNITDTFIRRPVLSVSISLLILLLGLYAVINTAFRQFPEMTNTVITVSTTYYGADANLVQGFVTTPLEQAIAQANNIDYMTSNSSIGTSTINVYMKLDTNPDSALAEILSKVNSVRSELPQNVQDPVISSSTGASVSLLYIAFTSKKLNSSQITDFLSRVVQPKMLTVQGVATATLYGGSDFGLRIWLNPSKMAAYGLTADEVTEILRSNNYLSATGQINNYFVQMNTVVNTQASNVKELSNLIIKTNTDGSVIRLSDIAKVALAKERDTVRAYSNGKNAVVVAINPTPSANPLKVVERVKSELPGIKQVLPSAIHMRVLYDSTQAINESIYEVIKTLAEAAIIVMIVMILFMGSLRAVAIPVVTIPLSLIGVVILMNLFGFTFNLLTLLAMVLAIGLVVDDAIVVVENVDRHIKNGESPFRAAIYGTREIAVPVISMTLTLAAVYSPIALMNGITGALFKEFALTLAGAVFISGIIALTLSPMMCSKLMKPQIEPNRFELLVNAFYEWLSKSYTIALKAVMLHRQVIVVFAICVFIALPLMFKLIPTELAPKEDNGAFLMIGNAPQTANLDYVQKGMQEGMNSLKTTSAIASTLSFSGIPNNNQGMALVMLKPWSERSDNEQTIVKKANNKMKNNPTIALSGFGFPAVPGSVSGMPVQFVITSSDSFENIYNVATKVAKLIANSSRFIFSRLDLNFSSGTLSIKIDKNKAGAYGITMKQVGDTLSAMMTSGLVGRTNLNGRPYEVIPQVERKFRFTSESIGNYYLKAKNGTMIPLKSLITTTISGQPQSFTHFNQMNSATISMVPMPGSTIGQAVQYLKTKAVPLLPKNYQYNFLGEARQYVQEGGALYIIFVLALCIIFLVLACQFESMRDPVVILISVPLAVCGALLFMAWGMASMNIYTQVGLVTLIGLICKHGILICEVAKEQQICYGLNRMDAVMNASKLRLRAILMTTISMLAGLFPLLFATGPGAASRFDIGLIIIAGLGIGTIFTLFVLPVIYTFIASEHKPLPQVS